MQFSCSEDLDTLLLRVTQELKAYCTTKGEKQINETLLRGVTKKLYFNPGLSHMSPGQSSNVVHNQHPPSASQRSAALEITGVAGMEKMRLDDVWSGIGVDLGPCVV